MASKICVLFVLAVLGYGVGKNIYSIIKTYRMKDYKAMRFGMGLIFLQILLLVCLIWFSKNLRATVLEFFQSV